MKRLLIMGASAPLKEVILDCKSQGIYTIVVDMNPNAPSVKYADEHWCYSLTDIEGVCARFEKEPVDAVMNYCTDAGQKIYQALCERFHLPCVASFEQYDIMSNKDNFVACCRAHGVGTIPDYKLDENCHIIAEGPIEYPLMIKPADSTASKGLVVCPSEDKLEECIRYALSFSKRKKILVQKYMQGCDELCVKYMACDGELFLTSMGDVYTCYTEEGMRVYLGTQTYPSRHFAEYLETTDATVRAMLKDIGIRNGAMSLTGFYDHGTFRFFDPSLRMGGAQDWRIVNEATGVDISRCLTNFALTGSMGNIDEIRKIDCGFAKRSSAIFYCDVHPGTITAFDGIEEAARLPGVFGYHQCHFIGDTISSYGTNANVAIRFLLSCRDTEELQNTIRAIESVMTIRDENGNNMIVSPFDPSVLS